MGNKILISVVLGTYNRLNFLKLTLESIRREMADFPHEIIVIDGGSTDGTINWLTKQKDVISIIQHNRGIWRGKQIKRRSWGYFMNLGFKAAQGKYICMLSDDCLVVPGAIKNGYNLYEEKLEAGEKVGAMAFYWRNWPEEDKYYVCLTMENKMLLNHGLYLSSVLKEVDYIDEENYQFYHGDDDLALKIAHAGYKCIDSPVSFIEHYLHANTKLRGKNALSEQQDLKKLLNKWSGIFACESQETIHSRIEKDFVDTSLTANGFKKAEMFDYGIRIQKIKKRLIRTLTGNNK